MSQCSYERSADIIGEGGFGSVEIVEKNGKKYVYKTILADEGGESYFYDPIELDIMFRMKSPHLLEGVEIITKGECDKKLIGLVSEYLDGNLADNAGEIPYSDAKKIMHDLALGVKCMHDNKFLHLDIKIDNAMYHTTPVRGVLIDYGLASYCPEGIEKGIDTHQGRITTNYMSPRTSKEAVKQGKYVKYHYNNKDDIWSLAIVFMEIINGNNPIFNADRKEFKELNKAILDNFSGDNIDSYLQRKVYKYCKDYLPGDEKDSFDDLLKKMIKINENERLNIDEVLNHPYFESFDHKAICYELTPGKYSLDHVTPERLNELRTIAVICKMNIPGKSLDILFMAYDIYLRFISQSNVNYGELAQICVLIAYKYFYWADLGSGFGGEIDFFTDEENFIYKTIGGKIREERYLKYCNTLSEAQAVFDHFINFKNNTVKVRAKKKMYEYNKNVVNYLQNNGKDFVESHRNNNSKPINQCSIKDLEL